MSEGFRIRKNWQRIEASLVEAFGPIPVANVSDSMARMDAGGSDLRPMHRDGKLAGPALPVRMRPGDNLMPHKAIDMDQPGEAIICDAGGDGTNPLFGEFMLTTATVTSVTECVINGGVGSDRRSGGQ